MALAKTSLRAPPQRPPRTGQKHTKYYQLTYAGMKEQRQEFFNYYKKRSLQQLEDPAGSLSWVNQAALASAAWVAAGV